MRDLRPGCEKKKIPCRRDIRQGIRFSRTRLIVAFGRLGVGIFLGQEAERTRRHSTGGAYRALRMRRRNRPAVASPKPIRLRVAGSGTFGSFSPLAVVSIQSLPHSTVQCKTRLEKSQLPFSSAVTVTVCAASEWMTIVMTLPGDAVP